MVFESLFTSQPNPVLIQRDGDDIWIGSNTATGVKGTIDLTDPSDLERRPSAAILRHGSAG
jgi:hypothetical protein